jgi:hypothetical protein
MGAGQMATKPGRGVTPAVATSASAFLARADRVYRSLVDRAVADRDRHPARALDWISAAARVATAAHTGRFTDPAAEQLLLDIGRRDVRASHVAPRSSPVRSSSPRRVVHVATRLLPVGGHSRLLINWIRNDTTAVHSVVLTDQADGTLSSWVRAALDELRVPVTTLSTADSWTDRAGALRDVVCASADTVLLHTHQFDVVAPLALAVPATPPVAVVNHSDHTYWLGASVADTIVCIRPFAWEVSAARRAARSLHLVPIPLAIRPTPIDRAAARAKLGLSPTDVALLTISARHKLTPTATHDFFAVGDAILRRHPEARIYVVGTTLAEVEALLPSGTPRERFLFVGPQSDPSVYQAAADIYLEGLPYGSLTALLESVAFGAFPVLMYAPTPQLDTSDDPAFVGIVTKTHDREEYLRHVGTVIADHALRVSRGAAAARAVLAHHTGDEWRAAVARMYADLDGVRHAPVAPAPERREPDSTDLNRASWDALVFVGVPLSALGAPALRTIPELLRLFTQSVRSGDTRLTPHQARAWLSVIKRHFVGYPPA